MEAVLMIAAVLFLAILFLGIPALAKMIARRKQMAVPPSHPAERRRQALNRAADWDWPR